MICGYSFERERERENRKTAEGPPPSPEDLCPPSTTASLIECLIDARSVDDDATDDPESRRLEEENQLRRPSLRPTKVDRLVRPPIGPRGKLAFAAGFPSPSSSRSFRRPPLLPIFGIRPGQSLRPVRGTLFMSPADPSWLAPPIPVVPSRPPGGTILILTLFSFGVNGNDSYI